MNNKDKHKYYNLLSNSLKERHKSELMNIALRYYLVNENVSWYALLEYYGNFELEQFNLIKHNESFKL